MDTHIDSVKQTISGWFSKPQLPWTLATIFVIVALIGLWVYLTSEPFSLITGVASPFVEDYNIPPEVLEDFIKKEDLQQRFNKEVARQTAYALERRGGLVVREGEIPGGGFQLAENSNQEGEEIDEREFKCGGTCGVTGKGLENKDEDVGVEEFQGEGEDREIAKQTAYALEKRGGLVIRQGDIEGGSIALAENTNEEGTEIDEREFACGGTCGVKGKGLETQPDQVGVEEFSFGLIPVKELFSSPYGDGHYAQKNCMGVW